MHAHHTFPVIFTALPHFPQTNLVLLRKAASPSCSLWAAPVSSFLLWVSWPEEAGRSSSPAAWHPLSLSVIAERKHVFPPPDKSAVFDFSLFEYLNSSNFNCVSPVSQFYHLYNFIVLFLIGKFWPVLTVSFYIVSL